MSYDIEINRGSHPEDWARCHDCKTLRPIAALEDANRMTPPTSVVVETPEGPLTVPVAPVPIRTKVCVDRMWCSTQAKERAYLEG